MKKSTKSDRWKRELLSIAHIQGINWSAGTEARTKALEGWIDNWITEYEFSQDIIKKELTSDDMDFVKYHCATKIAEEAMEDSAYLNLKNSKVSVRMLAIKKDK